MVLGLQKGHKRRKTDMAYRIVRNGSTCTENNEEKTWKQIYAELERGKTSSFVLDLRRIPNTETENDDLGWVLELGLCMCIHSNRTFYLSILCQDNEAIIIGNKFANFLRFFVDEGILQLMVNHRVKTTDKVKDNIPDAYFPMLIMNQDMYSEWFLKSLSDMPELKSILCEGDLRETKSFYSEMAMKVCRKMLYSGSKSESEEVKKKLEEIYEECLKSHSIMTVLLSCILYNRYRKGIRITGDKAIPLLKKTIKAAYIYRLGLQEVCENILRHTEAGKGIVYLRTLSVGKVKERFVNSVSASGQEFGKDENFNFCDTWMELTIIDAGKQGILETQKDGKRSLAEMFEWSSECSDVTLGEAEEIAEIEAFIYHKGLRIFNNQVRMTRGMFYVQTVNQEKSISYCQGADGKGWMEEREYGLGTQYKIWLPMTKENEQFQEHVVWGIEDITDGYRAYQSYNTGEHKKLVNILYEDICADYKVGQRIAEMSVKSNALAECKKMMDFINENQSSKEFYYFDFEEVDSEYTVKLMYFLALTANERNMRYVIFYNVDQNHYMQFVTNYQDNIGQKWIKKKQKNYVFIFSKQGTPLYVTNDFDSVNSEQLKMYLWSYRGIYYEGIKETAMTDGISPEEQSAVLLPVEVLNGRKEKAFSAPIFEKHMSQLFGNQMSDSEKFGLQYVGHVNLGDKIHVRRYFQGELLFDNNYYLGALAYILARALGNKKKFFLVGYKKYSTGLLNKMKEYMENNVVGTYIFDKIDHGVKIPDIPEETEIVVIVPIASTLRTFEKVERFLRKEITKDYQYSYYAFFVSRDQDEDVTELEAKFNWSSIRNDAITLNSEWPLTKWSKQRDIRYFMMFSGGWQHAMECEQCDEIKSDTGPIEALMGTGEDSLNLSVKLGIPYNDDPEGFKCYTKSMDEETQQDIYANMSRYIIEGHFERSENHFKHYLFCGKFFEEYLKESTVFHEWLNALKAEIQSEGQEYVNILLVPEHYSNNMLSKYVNKKVFDENTIIINENFHKEFYSDFSKKYNYLKKLRKIRYVFLDDCVNTGNTWEKVYSLVSNLGSGEKQFYIISLVNRLDYSNKVLLAAQSVKCRFFTEIYIPSIKEQNGNCWLCEETKHLERLCKDSFSYEMKQFYTRKILKIRQFNIEDEEERIFKDFRERKKNTEINFRITNELYRQMFKNYKLLHEGKTESFCDCFGVNSNYIITESIIRTEVDFEYKIAFVKTLSRPFINNFAGLRNFCINVCMSEFCKLIEEKKSKSKEEAILQMKYLIVLIKRFGTLQCRFILNKECFQKILDFSFDGTSWNEMFDECNLALHYAVAVRQMVLGSEVNTLRFLENFSQEFVEAGIIEAMTGVEKKLYTREELTIQFLKNIFYSRDSIIENAIRNYKTDCEVLKQEKTSGREQVLNNHTYNYYQRELACFGIKEREKANTFLVRIKQLTENLEGVAAGSGGMEEVGFYGLFQEILGEIDDFRMYIYSGEKVESYYKIDGREVNAPERRTGVSKQKEHPIGMDLSKYMYALKQEANVKIAHIVTLDDRNVCLLEEEFYFNIAKYSTEKVTGLIFMGIAQEWNGGLALILYRLLCGLESKITEWVAKVEKNSIEKHEQVRNASLIEVMEMRGGEM